MSFAGLEQITTVLNKTAFIAEKGFPFNRTQLLSFAKLEHGSVHAVISEGTKIKIMFRIASGICASRNSQNPFVHIDPANLDFTEDKYPEKSDSKSRLMKLGVALVSSVIEGFKPYVFTDINIAKSIEEIVKSYDSGRALVFTTLRIPTDVPNQLKYKVAVYSNIKRTQDFSILNILEVTITKSSESISVKIDREKARKGDTIAINAIIEKLLVLLVDNKYIDIEGSDISKFNMPGKWDFDNYRN